MATPDQYDDLGDRMKHYEGISRHSLTPKVPVLLRLDGKAFHTLTRGMDRPFDERFAQCMWEAAKYLCANVQGCQLAYVQSDEITLLLVDYQDVRTQGWFNYDVQKMVSVAASMASAVFNEALGGFKAAGTWDKPIPHFAAFDCRAWNIPKDEVVNCFIWRQQDASRNSVQMVGRAHFSHDQLEKVSCAQVQERLFQEKGVNWNDTPTWAKRGACVVKQQYVGDQASLRSRWVVDREIPLFTADRSYVQRFVDQGGAT